MNDERYISNETAAPSGRTLCGGTIGVVEDDGTLRRRLSFQGRVGRLEVSTGL
jgi:hypothetical protein